MKDAIVLFVHGLGATSESTWGKFGSLIAADEQLSKRVDVAFYEYKTKKFRCRLFRGRLQKVSDLAAGLRAEIDYRYDKYRVIYLVGHSMGGLVIRHYLLSGVRRGTTLKVPKAILFAVPNRGAEIAAFANLFSLDHAQLQDLKPDSPFLEALNESWEQYELENKLEVKYIAAGLDEAVRKQSALLHDGLLISDKAHSELVDVQSDDDISFLALRSIVLDTQTTRSTVHVPNDDPKILFKSALDVDPVSVKRVLDAFPKQGAFQIEWPQQCDYLVSRSLKLLNAINGGLNEESPFEGASPEDIRGFMTYAEGAKTVADERARISARVPYLLEEMLNSEIFDMEQESVLSQFVRFANYKIHAQLAIGLSRHRALAPHERSLVDDQWRALVSAGTTEKALSEVMHWSQPIYTQNVIELSGQRMNRNFYVPERFCRGAFSVTKSGFVNCIVPQYEYSLATDDPAAAMQYDGRVASTKTIDQDSKDVYP